MLKNLIYPVFFNKDISNVKMALPFFDKQASKKVFLYKTNQNFDELFFDENNEEIRIINFYFYKEIEIFISQNYAAQMQTNQIGSISKTLAYSNEIEFYSKENLKSLVSKSLFFFTFDPIEYKSGNDLSEKFILKSFDDNIDKNIFRFSKIKSLKLSSLLIKNFNNWYFQQSPNLNRTKIKSISLEFPSYAALGNIKLQGNLSQNLVPQNIDYEISSIVHPFLNLEPNLINAAFGGGKLSLQLPIWDFLGKCIEELKSYRISPIDGLNHYMNNKYETTIFGLECFMPGVEDLRISKGLAYLYMQKTKDQSNDKKQYFWNYEGWGQIVPESARTYETLQKRYAVSRISDFKNFLSNSNPNFAYNWWVNSHPDNIVGNPFYSFSMKVLNSENFVISNSLMSDLQGNEYFWCLSAQMNFAKSMFTQRFPSKNSFNPDWLNPKLYINQKVLPYGFMSVDDWKKLNGSLKTNNSQIKTIVLNLKLIESQYLNSIEINSLCAENVKIKIVDINNQTINFETYLNFYLIGQDQTNTKISFY